MPLSLYNCTKRNKTLRYLLKTKECRARIKADQINVLRKQYDAFLEEDKKRKERNEHILEKLDNMRLSNTVARYKSNVYLDQRVSFNCIGEAPINIYPHPQTNQPAMVNPLSNFKETATPTDLGVLAKPMDETYILNEISKKYILIPKLRSIAGEDYIPRAIKQDNNNEGDWKSKYSILDKLKQNEKEETNSFSVLKDNGKSFLDDIPTREPENRFDDEGNSPKDKIAEKAVAAKYATVPLACQDENGTIDKITTDIKKEKTIRQCEVAPNLNTHSSALKTDTDNEGQLQLPNRGTAGFGVSTEQYTYPTQEVVPLTLHETGGRNNDPIYNDKHENEDNEKLTPVVNDITHVEEIDPIKPETQKTKSDHDWNTGNSEKLQYPIDIINVQDFTPAEGVKLVDGVNINPDSRAVQQKYMAPSEQNRAQEPAEHAYQPKAEQPQGDAQYGSQPTDSSEEAYLPGANQPPGGDHYVSDPTASGEQAYLPGDQQPLRDHYVSEPVAVAAEQQEHIAEDTEQHQQSAYDQTADVTSEIQAFEDEQNQMFYSEQANYQDPNAVGDGYSGDTNYDPSLLYGGVQQEAAYPVEINEHEETSQRYDPSYEEQYAAKDAEQLYAEQQYSDQQYTEQQYSDQQYTEQQYSDQQYTEQQYSDQQNTEQGQYGEQPYAEQQYGEQPYAEQPYAEQQYGEQQLYDGQQYGDQQQYVELPDYTDQTQGEPVVATLQEYDQAYTLQEQTMEQIEQQLDNEELNVASQDAVGDIVDESIMYTQNEEEMPATEQYVENQNPEPITPKV
ncbi:uncharacterized protein LOC134673222 isoform X2 [Cydia fagiglandana]|uniref:uncharacterized protein LOC134673222 isoform X2 n=1 Tax=Cydia fagiglandana TaxID=1458189 RepID=UPI002FEE5030